MSKTLDKLAAASAKAETKTDYYGKRFFDYPFSWVVALIVLAFAAYGALRLFFL